MPKKKWVYTIEHSSYESHEVLAVFFSKKDRDAVFKKIEEMPAKSSSAHQSVGLTGWEQKSVSFSKGDTYGHRWVMSPNNGHGIIYKSKFEVHEGEIPVYNTNE